MATFSLENLARSWRDQAKIDFPSVKSSNCSSLCFSFFVCGCCDKSLMNVGNDTTTGNSGLDKAVEFFVTSNCELKMAGSDSLHSERTTGVTCKFKNLSGEVFKNSCSVDGWRGTNSGVWGHSSFQESVDATHRELIKLKRKISKVRKIELIFGS